jgi:hypothetical protein
MGKEKAIQEQELKEHEQNTLSSHYLFGVDLGLGEALILLNCVLYGVVVVGGIYSPNHQFNRWGGCLSMGAPDSPVRHRTLSGVPATSPNR